MSVYEKARELGEMILETKEGKRYYDAKYVYDGDDDAKKALMEYSQFKSILQNKVHEGNLSEEEFKEELSKLNKIGEKAQQNPVVSELMSAEGEFNRLVNSVFDILKGTVTKSDGGCSGSCSSCGGCH